MCACIGIWCACIYFECVLVSARATYFLLDLALTSHGVRSLFLVGCHWAASAGQTSAREGDSGVGANLNREERGLALEDKDATGVKNGAGDSEGDTDLGWGNSVFLG